MRRRDLFRAAGSLGILSALPVSGCAADSMTAGAPTPVPTRTVAPQAIGGRLLQAKVARQQPVAAAAARNKLLPVSAALYRAALPGDGNAVLSPYSIVSALGMLALGARGTTARQLATALGGDAATVARWLGGVDAALARAVTASSQPNFDGPIAPAVIEPANGVFLRPGSDVRAAYLDALSAGYGAGIREVDFGDVGAATATINDWVGQRTHGLIPKLLPPGFVDQSTLLVLINALYLKAAWANPFDKGTTPQPFTTPSGTVQVPFMTRSGGIPQASGRNWRAVSIPLVTGLAMTVIVPNAGAFSRVSTALDDTLLATAMNGEERGLELAMPAFTTDLPTDLRTPLAAMGLAELFTGPDLSGIAAGVHVSGAVHQAKVVVDHHGVEAAAATAIAIPSSAPAPADPLRVDRPFLYVLHDVETCTPLFLGRVTDPTR